MVDASLALADAAGLGHALDGLLVLAVVTSLPNAVTALRLARQGRGDANVSETMSSNTINLVGGIVLPAVIVGLGAIDAGVRRDVVWMCVLTAATLLALARPSGMGRAAGAALVAAYVVFVLAHVV
jgi:cation:H+ antiporter